MSWQYSQTTGQLLDPDGKLVAIGYSGHGNGLNDPDLQHVMDIGPLPRGAYDFGQPFDSPNHGPYTLPLLPHDDTQTFGRSEFKVHGDEIDRPGQHLASLGCVILPRFARIAMWNSTDHVLESTL